MDLKPVIEPLTFVIGAAGLFVTVSALLQNLERSRRELASNLIYNWANHLDWPTSRALTLLPRLDQAVIDDIHSKREASLPADLYEAVVSILSGEFTNRELPQRPEGQTRAFQISAEHSAHIRFLWVRWLNRLEGTLTAWKEGAASADVMRNEFEPLVIGRQAELAALEQVLIGLPVVKAFYEHARDRGTLKVRSQLGIWPWRR